MYKKILFPMDFSDVAMKAVKYVAQLKGAGAQEVVLLHVLDERELMVLSTRAPDQYIRIVEELKSDVAEEMARIRTDLASLGFVVKAEIKTGRPARVITDTAEEEKVSIIAMGSHGKSNVAEMLMGSVSENVMRHARVPLLMVNRDVRPEK